MEPDRGNSSGRVFKDEFGKRAADLQVMIDHMKIRADLVKKIGNEEIIPEQARDMAIMALSNELKENLSFFFNYLINFIHIGMQGLHRVDFEAGCTFLGNGIIQTDSCVLHIDVQTPRDPCRDRHPVYPVDIRVPRSAEPRFYQIVL